VASGVSVGQLPQTARAGLTPSPEEQKKGMLGSDAGAQAWDVPPAQGIVMVYEPAPGVCKVMGYGAPVAATFGEALRRAERAFPDFHRIELKPGYDPIRMGLERSAGGKTLRIVLSGAEPGAPGHMFRFSLLTASVMQVDAPNAGAQR
jgi:hypothetical protein